MRRFPASSHQQRLWFIDQLNPGSPVYNTPRGFRLLGRLNHEAVRKALDAVVARHEPLRTRILMEGDAPIQVIDTPRPARFSILDLRSWPESGREEELHRCLREEALLPFNLTSDVMLRALLVQLDQEEHVLLLTLHHIASDGWSLPVLCRELSMLYSAEATGKPAELPPLPVTYAGFVAQQRMNFDGERYKRDLAYWKEQLTGLPELDLPTDRPDPAHSSYAGAQVPISVSPALVGHLRAFSKRERVTLFMTLVACFKILLYRYTGREDLAVGVPGAGRSHIDVEGLIGFFIDTLVLRTDLSGSPTFRAFVGRVRKVALEAYTRHQVPFDNVVAEINPERRFADHPLFQVMFNFANLGKLALELEGARAEEVRVETGMVKFPLTMKLSEVEGGLTGVVEYKVDIFDRETIERLVGHYITLLEGVTADPDRTISEFPILTGAEQHQILHDWNDTRRDYPTVRCAHELFEEQALRAPHAVAVVDESRSLTYAELNRRANQLAHHLRDLGIGPERTVGICLERSVDVAVAVLGILKAGGAFVPLDPLFPPKRLAYILAETRATVLLTQASLADVIPNYSGRMVCLDTDEGRIKRHSDQNPSRHAGPNHLAYIIFTSGSTGRPKGVEIEHRSLSNYLCDIRGRFALGPETVLVNVIPFSFDPFLHDLLGPLLAGGRVVIASRETTLDGATLAGALSRYGATGLNATPTTWDMLVQTGWKTDAGFSIMCRGDALSPGLADRLLRTGGQLWNMYGPTETTLVTSMVLIRTGDGISVGRPISNTRIYILDGRLQPTPVGVKGGIYIGGDGVARGYLNQPDLTRERFISDPFCPANGARLYSTGDIGCFLPDGRIEHHGRSDDQIKIRGFRIEPGEIEVVLADYPGVRTAVVVSSGEGIGKKLTAYLVTLDGRDLPPADLRTHLRQRLPDPVIPARFVRLNALPLTPNGKIDRRALSTRVEDEVAPSRVHDRPWTAVEQTLASIWMEVLKLKKVDLEDNFFDLGGHSLLATQIVSRIREAYARKFPLRSIFDAPTIASLAGILEPLLSADAAKVAEIDDSLEVPPRKNSFSISLRPIPDSGGAGRLRRSGPYNP